VVGTVAKSRVNMMALPITHDDLKAMLANARAVERERCAKIVDSLANLWRHHDHQCAELITEEYEHLAVVIRS
jgi:hypothetical protein